MKTIGKGVLIVLGALAFVGLMILFDQGATSFTKELHCDFGYWHLTSRTSKRVLLLVAFIFLAGLWIAIGRFFYNPLSRPEGCEVGETGPSHVASFGLLAMSAVLVSVAAFSNFLPASVHAFGLIDARALLVDTTTGQLIPAIVPLAEQGADDPLLPASRTRCMPSTAMTNYMRQTLFNGATLGGYSYFGEASSAIDVNRGDWRALTYFFVLRLWIGIVVLGLIKIAIDAALGFFAHAVRASQPD